MTKERNKKKHSFRTKYNNGQTMYVRVDSMAKLYKKVSLPEYNYNLQYIIIIYIPTSVY